MAKCTPWASRPGMGRSRGFVAPAASSTASCDALTTLMSTFLPTCAFVTNFTPSAACAAPVSLAPLK